MELTIIKEALEHYVLSADCSDNKRDKVFAALKEVNSLGERYTDRELCDDSVYLVTVNFVIDMLNRITYDDFGKLAKANRGIVRFERYVDKVRHEHDFDVTDDTLRVGYDFISDLWRDNEADGVNNPDGTFCRTKQKEFDGGDLIKLRRVLNTARDAFKTMLLINGELYSPGEIHKLAEGLSDADDLLEIVE